MKVSYVILLYDPMKLCVSRVCTVYFIETPHLFVINHFLTSQKVMPLENTVCRW